jgi:glutamine cyclotransferase
MTTLAISAVLVFHAQRYSEAKSTEGDPNHYSDFISNLANDESVRTVLYRYKVINVYPHDPHAFTQGLIFDQGFLYESTGLRGRSTLRQVRLETGEVLNSRRLPSHYFGEGVTLLDGKLFQITWKSGTGFVYNKEDFYKIMEFKYHTEGWGIAQDGRFLIMSDGTSTLRFLDPNSFAVLRQVEVSSGGTPVGYLNELEYIKGKIYANIWQTDYIAIISPQTGEVSGWVDLAGLSQNGRDSVRRTGVLNGIAYDSGEDRIFVTGKLWPKLFEIELIPMQQ